MMGEWRERSLGELLDVKHGFAFLGQYFGEAGTHIVLTPGNFFERGGFKPKGDKEKWYSGPVPSEYVLRRGDIIVAMTEQAEGLLGASAIVPQDDLYLHNQRLGLVQIRNGEADRGFIYHLFNTPTVRQQIRATASGAKVRHTAPSRIAAVRVMVPGIKEQQRIGGILSAYDDLIDNCDRRIRVLDQMARGLYHEWFVLFRYPGRGATPLVKSRLGDIPQGWRTARVVDEFRTVLGGTPSRSKPEYWSAGTVPWINSGKVNELRVISPSEHITPLALERSAAKLMPPRTTVLAITGATLGQVSYLEIETSANQSVVGIVDPSGSRCEWLYLTVSARIDGIIKAATGGAQQHINKEVVNETLLPIPPPELVANFSRYVKPMFDAVATLLREANCLRETRALLLPRLLAGRDAFENAA